MAYIITGDCILCGSCVDACPVGAIVLKENYEIDKGECVECGACMDECPMEAIKEV